MKKITIIFLSFYSSLTLATASGPDYLEVEIEGKKEIVKNLGCDKKECTVLFKKKEVKFPIGKTRESAGPITPTFDCSKAKYKAEKITCADSNLSNLDRHLAIIYKDSIRKIKNLDSGSKAALKKTKAVQRGWYKGKNDCWKDQDITKCVERNYKQRISYLQARWDLVESFKKEVFYCDNQAEIVLNYYKTSYFEVIKAEAGDQVYTLLKNQDQFIGDYKYISFNDSKLETSILDCKEWKKK